MIGKHEIIIENAYLQYRFTISRNITVIKGDSATGKTTLIEMIRQYNEEEDSGISIKSDVPLEVVYGRNWKIQLDGISESIVFIDEQSRFIKSKEFAESILGSNNYYVIVTREKLHELPYSINEVYGIRTSGKYANLKGEYTQNEFYRIYGQNPSTVFAPDVIITEDSGSGFEFWKSICNNVSCISASGKSNILNTIKEQINNDARYLAIVDGAAFGAEMEGMIEYIRYGSGNVELYAPESFEYLLLTSNLFNSAEIKDKCSHTENYADSQKYLSWERFYTALITEITNGTKMQYSKDRLNMFYLSERNKKIILSKLPDQLKFK